MSVHTALEGVLSIGWADEASRNAVGSEAARRIVDRLALAEDPQVRVVVLAGEQSPFCSGWDLRDLAGLDVFAPDDVTRYFEAGRELLRAIEACPVPVVAAVSGVALGFGCSILAHADLVVADAGAQFGLPEVRRGFAPATVMPELLEAMDAREVRAWALTGARHDVHRAGAAGLVHRIAPPGTLPAVLTEVVEGLAEADPTALRTTKALLHEQRAMPLPQRRVRGVAAAVDHFCRRNGATR